jgi:hypothetical protein
MRRLRALGSSFNRIAVELNERGIRPRRGTKWHGATVNGIIGPRHRRKALNGVREGILKVKRTSTEYRIRVVQHRIGGYARCLNDGVSVNIIPGDHGVITYQDGWEQEVYIGIDSTPEYVSFTESERSIRRRTPSKKRPVARSN